SGTTWGTLRSLSFRVFIVPIFPPFPVGLKEIAPRAPSPVPGTTAILPKIHDRFHAGDHPRRGLGPPPLPAHARDEQATRSDLQQAHDLLPALDAHPRRDPPHPAHHQPARQGP